MELGELVKRIKRIFDGNFSNRKTVLILIVCLSFIFYIIPSIFRIFFQENPLPVDDIAIQRLQLKLMEHAREVEELDAYITRNPVEQEHRIIPYVGNGYIGTSTSYNSKLFMRDVKMRSLSTEIPFYPIVNINFEGWSVEEATITQYRKGLVTKYQIYQSTNYEVIDITYDIYAHRAQPSLIYQDIKITNPNSRDISLNIQRLGTVDWTSSTSEFTKIVHGNGEHEYLSIKGMLPISGSDLVQPVSIVTLKVPDKMEVRGRYTTTLHVITSVNYTSPVKTVDYGDSSRKSLESATKSLKDAIANNAKFGFNYHTKLWDELWLSGFFMSHSKAENALNGDLINATIYNVLSHVPAPLYDADITQEIKNTIQKDLTYAEGCYGGHSTLQASRLWSTLHSVEEVNKVVSVWIMTLEKQGCHQLLRAGAEGVMQSMLLSFGGLQFKNQHLEFNIDPQHLHRDYLFRRLNYGNATHLNISVEVQEEDYKAVLFTALDRSDKSYYACDAGCLDSIKQLGPERATFPVKKTHPLTAILYITSDKVHLEELKHTIHVHEIAIAPAHEHQLIALHRHGHRWGGLPTMFWVSIVALIVIFHLFLFKLVFNEYCSPDIRLRYRKLSDF